MTDITNVSDLTWRFGRTSRQPFGDVAPIDDAACATEWLPARVPGDVHADLIANGGLASIDTPEGIASAQWVDDFDWWYRTVLPGYPDDAVVVLEADGIDYYSAIWLDDHLLSTHAGMFSRQSIVLSPWINLPGRHELRVRVWGAGALPRPADGPLRRGIRALVSRLSPGTEFFPDRMNTPKAQFSFGWDFAPRLLTAGIWDEMRLVSCSGAYLGDVQLIAEPLDEGDPCRVHWSVRLNVQRFDGGPFRACVQIEPEAGGAGLSHTEFALEGTTPEFGFDMPTVRRWWPWDQGESALYRVTVQLLGDRGILDQRVITTGVRTIRRETLSDGKPWRFMVNGHHVFLRGANWVPPDVLPGCVGKDDYERLLSQARAAGINFLRVWGGGVREKAAFWDACDRRGILAWQEFPLACAFLDHYPRSNTYLTALEQEAIGTVRLLCNHPSLLAWCGGNEINPQREAAPLAVIESVLRKEDPARPWIPASPLAADGDAHDWDVWHGAAPWTDLAGRLFAFMSEFGLQALPDAASIDEMFAGKPPELSSPEWAARKAQTANLRHYGGQDIDRSVKHAIETSQRVQAAALQLGIEASRLRRESGTETVRGRDASCTIAPCGGVAFWQFNEPWPAVTWSVVDRSGRTKLAYTMLTRSYHPVLVAARFTRRCYRVGEQFAAEIWLVNDTRYGIEDCVIKAHLDGQRVWRAGGVHLPAASVVRAGAFDVAIDKAPAQLTLSLSSGATPLTDNVYDLGVPLPPPQRLLPRLRRRLADWLVTG